MAERLTLEITPEYGYIVAVVAAMFVAQNIVMVIPVLRQRFKTGIKAPTLYPRDHEIKMLKLSDEQVRDYMVAQRAHQNNVEFTSVFMPLFLVAGLFPAITLKVAIAGAWVVFWRLMGAMGYLFGVRQIGAPYALGAYYILYLAVKQAYELAHPVMPADHMELFYVVRSGAEVIKAHVHATVETLPETLAAARASAGF